VGKLLPPLILKDMYNASTIKTGFSGLLGLSNPRNPKYPRVPSTLTSSTSGLYFNKDFHPITTIENIYFAVEDVYRDSEQWTSGTYSSGVIYRNDGYVYRSLEDDNTEEPSINATKWEWVVYSEIREMIDNACVTVVRNLLQEMRLLGQTKGLFTDWRIFDRSGKYSDTVTKRGAFVGFRLATHSAHGLVYDISQIGLQLTDAQDSLTIYCYHSSKSDPLFTKELSSITAKNFSWHNIAKTISGMVDENDAGGFYYIGYYDSDLTGNAINRKYDFSRAPSDGCSSCQKYDLISYKQWSKYYRITPFYVVDTEDDRTLFNTEDVIESYDNNFGLNISLGVRCDLSSFLVDNKLAFADAIGVQFSAETMNKIQSSPRGNNMTDRLRDYAATELYGINRDYGYKSDVSKAIKSINIDITSLKSPCLGKQSKGMSWV
jgi:hypothetical protein